MANFKKCFVTVGTTRFDRLCNTIVKPEVIIALTKLGCEEVICQIGNSDCDVGVFKKEGVNFTFYRFKNDIQQDIEEADLVISHAGAGSCLETLDNKKPLLVVINEDLMDNHQIELAERLHVDGHLYYCTCDTLENTLLVVDFALLFSLPKPDTGMFVKYLDDVLRVKNI